MIFKYEVVDATLNAKPFEKPSPGQEEGIIAAKKYLRANPLCEKVVVNQLKIENGKILSSEVVHSFGRSDIDGNPVDPVLRARLEGKDGEEFVEFKASEVLAYQIPGEKHVWSDIPERYQDSMAEDFALWNFKRKYGDYAAYRVDLVELEEVANKQGKAKP